MFCLRGWNEDDIELEELRKGNNRGITTADLHNAPIPVLCIWCIKFQTWLTFQPFVERDRFKSDFLF